MVEQNPARVSHLERGVNVMEVAFYSNDTVLINGILLGLAFIGDDDRNSSLLVVRPKSMKLSRERGKKDPRVTPPVPSDSTLAGKKIVLEEGLERVNLGEGQFILIPTMVDTTSGLTGLVVRVESPQPFERSGVGEFDSRSLQRTMRNAQNRRVSMPAIIGASPQRS